MSLTKGSVVKKAFFVKMGFGLIAAFAITSSSFAGGCLFGEQTNDGFDWEDGNSEVIAEMKSRGLKAQESVAVHVGTPLDDLTTDAIDLMIRQELPPRPSKAEVARYWDDFRNSDGYYQFITKDGVLEYGYIVVASYPGDNQYGAVFAIIPLEDGIYDLRKVADISDSFLENCIVR
jgi:hypothetical protein